MNLNKNFQPIKCTNLKDITLLDTGEIISKIFDDIYFYPNKGAEETDHTFINGNNIPERWHNELNNQYNKSFFIIGETGFGTGLNFLCTWNKWREFNKNKKNITKKTLYYISTELHPLTFECLKKILSTYNPFPELSEKLMKIYPDAIGGDYLLNFDCDSQCSVKLLLLFGDSTVCLSRLENYPGLEKHPLCDKTIKFDAWFLDGFSPNKNPKMWSRELLELVAKYSHKSTTLATYSSAKLVKDKLKDVGFQVKKIPAYGKKREMIKAIFSEDCKPSKKEKPFRMTENLKESLCYYRNFNYTQKPKDIIIVGAGIAGCTIAYQLKKRGHNVKLIEKEKGVAYKASGNLKAVLYSRTAKERSHSSDFYEAAMHYAQQFYRNLDNGSFSHGLNGMVKLNKKLDKSLLSRNNHLRSRKNINKKIIKKITGLDINGSGILYPNSGWIDPVKVCNFLSNYSNIEIIKNNSVIDIYRDNDHWYIKTKKKEFNCDALIICCGHTTNKFKLIDWLKIKSIRGQTTHLKTTSHLDKLKTVLCYAGYITPSSNMIHDLGSSYNIDDLGEELNLIDQDENIKKLLNCFEKDSIIQNDVRKQSVSHPLSGHTGIRSTTSDYMPIVGPISQRSIFLNEFKNAKNLKKSELTGASLIDNLFINTGFGSNGFTTTPLASEILVSYIEGIPMPVSETIRRSISPNRFLYREHKRH